MGNNGFKRVLAIVLAATCMLVFSFSATFAATKTSPQSGIEKGSDNGNYSYNIPANATTGTAALKSLYKKTVKTKAVPSTISHEGTTCKITTIKKNAFKGCKKLTKVVIKDKYLTKVQKGAFNGAPKLKVIKIQKSKVGGKAKAKKIKKLLLKSMTAKQKKKIKIKIV